MLKKSFYAVLVAMLVAFCAGTAMAQNQVYGVPGTQIDGMVANDGGALPVGLNTHVNPGGLGDVLFYGYYNVRTDGSAPGANLFNIINTSPTTAIKVRVRFREGRASQEILDFNVCLSAGDRWTGLVLGDDAGPGTLYSLDDDTVTAPAIPASGVPFKYAPENTSWITADDTQEGYFEVFGAVAKTDVYVATKPKYTTGMTIPAGYNVGDLIPIWTPEECENAFTTVETRTGQNLTPEEVPNVLMGQNHIIPLDTLGSYNYNASALANCTIPGGVTGAGIDAAISNETPNVSNCEDGVNGVDYAYTKANVYSDYDAQDWLGSQTDMTLTFLTMHLHNYVPSADQFDDDGNTYCDSAAYDEPYAKAGATRNSTTGPAWYRPTVEVSLTIWDDEENNPSSTTGFSPSRHTTDILCNEVNVFRLGLRSNILNSNLRYDFSWPTSGFDIGWVRLDLTVEPEHVTSMGLNGTFGLPAIGYTLDNLSDLFPGMRPVRYDTEVNFGS